MKAEEVVVGVEDGEKRERVEAATERQITQWAKARSWWTLSF